MDSRGVIVFNVTSSHTKKNRHVASNAPLFVYTSGADSKVQLLRAPVCCVYPLPPAVVVKRHEANHGERVPLLGRLFLFHTDSSSDKRRLKKLEWEKTGIEINIEFKKM